jgi:plastocyanin
MRSMYLLAVVTLALGCSGDDGPSDPGNGDTDFTVSVVNNQFNPSALSVPVNSTVTWQWNSSGVEHNVTFQDGSPGASSRATGSFPRIFSAAGNFPYLCTLHPGMSGQVTVTAGSTGGGDGGGGGGGGGGGYPSD